MLSATSLQAFRSGEPQAFEQSTQQRQNGDAPGWRISVHVDVVVLALGLFALKRSVRFLLALSLAVLFLAHSRGCKLETECTVLYSGGQILDELNTSMLLDKQRRGEPEGTGFPINSKRYTLRLPIHLLEVCRWSTSQHALILFR